MNLKFAWIPNNASSPIAKGAKNAPRVGVNKKLAPTAIHLQKPYFWEYPPNSAFQII